MDYVPAFSVTHLSKSAGAEAVDWPMGLLAFAVARTVWCELKEPDDPQRRLSLPAKPNLASDRDDLVHIHSDMDCLSTAPDRRHRTQT